MLHDAREIFDQLKGVSAHMVGVALLWLENHGLGVLGAVSLTFGIYCQYAKLQLHKREVALKEIETEARMKGVRA